MRVTIKLFARLREIADNNEIELELPNSKSTVRQVLKALIQQYPPMKQELLYTQKFELKPIYKLMINDKSINNTGDMDYPISDGAIFRFFPPIYGG